MPAFFYHSRWIYPELKNLVCEQYINFEMKGNNQFPLQCFAYVTSFTFAFPLSVDFYGHARRLFPWHDIWPKHKRRCSGCRWE